MSYFVYMARCVDDTLYTGIAVDLDRRQDEHNGVVPGGAKYTRARRPVTIVWHQEFADRSSAMKVEYLIKQKTRKEKEVFVQKGSSVYYKELS